MSDSLARVKTMLQDTFKGSLMGTVSCSQIFDERTLTVLDVAEWYVSNGSFLTEPLYFGSFGVVQQLNDGKAKLRILTAPGFADETPTFPEICVNDLSASGDLVTAVICRKVVPVNDPVESGVGIWDCKIQPIDQVHGIRTTVKDPAIFAHKIYSITRESNLPSRFRGLQTVQETSQIVKGIAQMPILPLGYEHRSEEQITPQTKRLVDRQLDLNATSTYDDEQVYVEGTKVNVHGQLTSTRPNIDKGLLVVKSEITEINAGQYVRETMSAIQWPVLKGSRYVPALNAVLSYSEQFVAPPLDPSGENFVEYVPVNEDRTLRRTLNVPLNVLNNFRVTIPVDVNVDIPRVLKGITVVWNESKDAGTQEMHWTGQTVGPQMGLSCDLPDVASASVSAVPELLVETEDFWGRNLSGVGDYFYMPAPITRAAIMARLGATTWPTFHPQSHMLVCLGKKMTGEIRISISASRHSSEDTNAQQIGTTKSVHFDTALTNNIVPTGPVIHGPITVTGITQKTISTEITAGMNLVGDYLPQAVIFETRPLEITSLVTPTTFPATRGATGVPSGKFLIRCVVDPTPEWGYHKVYAETLELP